MLERLDRQSNAQRRGTTPRVRKIEGGRSDGTEQRIDGRDTREEQAGQGDSQRPCTRPHPRPNRSRATPIPTEIDAGTSETTAVAALPRSLPLTMLLRVMPEKPIFSLRNSRSMPNACPARAPHPKGRVFTRGTMSCRRYHTVAWRNTTRNLAQHENKADKRVRLAAGQTCGARRGGLKPLFDLSIPMADQTSQD